MRTLHEWQAVYADAVLPQYNEDGTENKYADIDRERLLYFDLYRDGKRVLRYHFDTPDKKLIFRRRVFLVPGGSEEVVYLVGWQIRLKVFNPDLDPQKGDQLEERSIQSLTLLFEDDGRVETYDGFKRDIKYEQPELNDHEGENWYYDLRLKN